MRVLLIALLAAISYAQTGGRGSGEGMGGNGGSEMAGMREGEGGRDGTPGEGMGGNGGSDMAGVGEGEGRRDGASGEEMGGNGGSDMAGEGEGRERPDGPSEGTDEEERERPDGPSEGIDEEERERPDRPSEEIDEEERERPDRPEGECMNDDDVASRLLAGAADMNINDCDSLVRWGKLNLADAFACDTFVTTMTEFGMANARVTERDTRTLSEICCASCSDGSACTLDKDSYQSEAGECELGEESFEFCGMIQCISNSECSYDDFGLDNPNDQHVCPPEFDADAIAGLGELLAKNPNENRFAKVRKQVRKLEKGKKNGQANYGRKAEKALKSMRRLSKKGYSEERWNKINDHYNKGLAPLVN